MKIILISIGTRGDMEPFLSIGEILKEKGHQVICAFPEQFRDLAEKVASHMEKENFREEIYNSIIGN